MTQQKQPSTTKIPKYFFDKRDYELLVIVNDVLAKDRSLKDTKKLLAPYLHPHGIKEMASSTGLRIAYAIIHLLGLLEGGDAQDRLNALRSLNDEVMSMAGTSLRYNTARVLMQIIKEMVRSRDDSLKQLQLARDFREAASGKPLIIRTQLRRFKLLEMPEAWNQIAFDDHVHDANTKGRKSPTHLIMDAWIKGIRSLTVVYYNFVQPEVVSELLQAAAIMDMKVRISIQLPALFRNKYIKMNWEPKGFPEPQDFLNFLAEPNVQKFMEQTRSISEYQSRYVFSVFKKFNDLHRLQVEQDFNINMPELNADGFRSFVGTGQASLLHLAKFIYLRMMEGMQARLAILREESPTATPEGKKAIIKELGIMNRLDSETIIERYLHPDKNPDIPNPHVPPRHNGDDLPAMLRYTPQELVHTLSALHSGYLMTLNLSNLNMADLIELLYDCKGMISHLEIFNLKDNISCTLQPPFSQGPAGSCTPERVNLLQQTINRQNVIRLKKCIRETLADVHHLSATQPAQNEELADRERKLQEILLGIAEFQGYYKHTPLKSRIGSGSTGRSRHHFGMGLVVKDTLPPRAQRSLQTSGNHSRIPVSALISCLTTRTLPPGNPSLIHAAWHTLKNIFSQETPVRTGWKIEGYALQDQGMGNIATLGGNQTEYNNGLSLEPPQIKSSTIPLRYLNTGVKNILKVIIGFIPAFATFALTKDWWLLAYFGAFIWFGITGLRNIIQSVLGGGGWRRSPLLRWNDYVSWTRITDSLLFTGFSVPLLDYVVKTLLLDQGMGITTRSNPLALYTIMALANGVYISSHNIFRGLPNSAVFGNFFRSILSIPLAIVYNAAIGSLLGMAGIPGVDDVLQKWAAVISKLASDCVAGIIEGLADRAKNMAMRRRDYAGKLLHLFDTYAQLEILFPQDNVLEKLESPKTFMQTINARATNLEKIIIINALDLLYFWMYQPRAREVLQTVLHSMSPEERQIFIRSQFILQRRREISQLFLNGIIGKRFSKPLAFYLARSDGYLEALQTMARKLPLPERSQDGIYAKQCAAPHAVLG